MTTLSSSDLTRLLREGRAGDPEAREKLWPIVYGELKKMAHAILRERPHRPYQTTVLVHELYLRLLGNQELAVNDRDHFFAVAARAMRFLLVDNLRRSKAEKRGGGEVFVPLDEALEVPAAPDVDLVALDVALDDLERLDPRKSRVVELSYFAGFTYDEIARALEISSATVKRELKTAKLWLLRELDRRSEPE